MNLHLLEDLQFHFAIDFFVVFLVTDVIENGRSLYSFWQLTRVWPQVFDWWLIRILVCLKRDACLLPGEQNILFSKFWNKTSQLTCKFSKDNIWASLISVSPPPFPNFKKSQTMFVYTVFFQLDCELPNDGDLFVKKKKKTTDTGTRLRSTTHILFFDILFSILMEKGMATHSSILTWEIPWTEDRGAWQATVHGVTRVGLNHQNSHAWSKIALSNESCPGTIYITSWKVGRNLAVNPLGPGALYESSLYICK